MQVWILGALACTHERTHARTRTRERAPQRVTQKLKRKLLFSIRGTGYGKGLSYWLLSQCYMHIQGSDFSGRSEKKNI